MFGIDDVCRGEQSNFSNECIRVAEEKGFLLVEAVIAIAIVSLAFVAVLQVAEASTKRHRNADTVRDAFLEAQSVLRSTIVSRDPINGTHITLSGGRIARVSSKPADFKLGYAAKTDTPDSLLLVEVEVLDAQNRTLASLQSIRSNASNR